MCVMGSAAAHGLLSSAPSTADKATFEVQGDIICLPKSYDFKDNFIIYNGSGIVFSSTSSSCSEPLGAGRYDVAMLPLRTNCQVMGTTVWIPFTNSGEYCSPFFHSLRSLSSPSL